MWLPVGIITRLSIRIFLLSVKNNNFGIMKILYGVISWNFMELSVKFLIGLLVKILKGYLLYFFKELPVDGFKESSVDCLRSIGLKLWGYQLVYFMRLSV